MLVLSGILASWALLLAAPLSGQAEEPVVNAIIFYSPTCPHCHQVINQDLPPLRQKYGSRLVIVGVDASTPLGSTLYEAVVLHFAIPNERLGVPALVVGNTVLVGSYEIPDQFPGIVERGIAAGGIDWPPVNAIRQALAAQGLLIQHPTPAPPAESPQAPRDTAPQGGPPAGGAQPSAPPTATGAGDTAGAPGAAPTAQAAAPGEPAAAGAPDTASGERRNPLAISPAEQTSPSTTTPVEPASPPAVLPSESDPSGGAIPRGPRAGMSPLFTGDTAVSIERPGPWALFLQDPVGNGMSVAVLLGLLAVLAWSLTVMVRPGVRAPGLPAWLFPALAVVGTVVAAYLSFVEVTGTTAVCGPVGDCNTVQQSEWARLFGVLPIGVLGLAGYAALAAAWFVATWGAERLRHLAWTAAWAMTLLGTAFSAYLTFLEPFVIGATCAWCLTSAVVMALMLVVATGRASAPPPA